MVQGLSLGLVLPLVHLIGQRLVNHYYVFSGLVLIARSDVRFQHDVRCQHIVLLSIVMAKVTRKTRRRGRRSRQKIQVLCFFMNVGDVPINLIA